MNINNIFNELIQLKTYKSLQKHYIILWFYLFVVFITSTVGHVIDKKDGFTYGLVIGFIISIILWYQFGKEMVY